VVAQSAARGLTGASLNNAFTAALNGIKNGSFVRTIILRDM
jgi:hypothetical protein